MRNRDSICNAEHASPQAGDRRRWKLAGGCWYFKEAVAHNYVRSVPTPSTAAAVPYLLRRRECASSRRLPCAIRQKQHKPRTVQPSGATEHRHRRNTPRTIPKTNKAPNKRQPSARPTSTTPPNSPLFPPQLPQLSFICWSSSSASANRPDRRLSGLLACFP